MDNASVSIVLQVNLTLSLNSCLTNGKLDQTLTSCDLYKRLNPTSGLIFVENGHRVWRSASLAAITVKENHLMNYQEIIINQEELVLSRTHSYKSYQNYLYTGSTLNCAYTCTY